MPVLFLGEVLIGFPWDIAQSCATSYASDICPLVLRGHLTMYVNLCWVIGQLLASGTLRGLVGNTTAWSYRIPFAIQWIWPVPLFCVVCFAPESPWWLVRKGHLQEAEHCVKRFSSASEKVDPKNTVAMMVHTNNLEKEMQISTFWDCFRGTNLRRT
jgi:SP family general alpha glucoside:H+ symporter-like MFS transporter